MLDWLRSFWGSSDLDIEEESAKKIAHLEKIIGTRIDDSSLFLKALRHRSITSDERFSVEDSYERLEFLGDAVLDLIVTELIYEHYPHESEGFMTKLRAQLVKGEALARYARRLNLGSILEVGERAQGQGIEYSKSILADVFESMVGALYITKGYRKTFSFVETIIHNYVDMEEVAQRLDNYKSRLLEFTQAEHMDVPRYEVVKETGPGHDKTFEIRVLINNEERGRGIGKSKKKAEQKAARDALKAMGVQQEAAGQ